MKRYFMLTLSIFTAAIAFAAPEPYALLSEYNEMNKTFFQKLVDNEEATYMICTNDGEKQYLKDERADKIFHRALNSWRKRTKRFITRHRMEEELGDILQILEKEPNLVQIPCQEDADVDLKISYIKDISVCGGNALGCINLYSNEIYIKAFVGADYVHTLAHELGHAFGLADLYEGAIYRGSFIYNSKVKRPSIMNGSKRVTCDDADGLITSIDRLNGTSREFRSLCNDGLIIKNGEGMIAANKTYTFRENFDNFNAKVTVYYDTEIENSYIVDMTLSRFILNQDGIDTLRNMGFEVSGLNAIRHAKVKIHGTVKERLEPISGDVDEDYVPAKTPLGLWTLAFYDGREEKQMVSKDFSEEEDEEPTIRFEDFANNTVLFNKHNLRIPLINLFHGVGSGLKEALRIRSIFRADLDKIDNKTKDNFGYMETLTTVSPTPPDDIPSF